MNILVTSNNGRVHLAEHATKLNISSKENKSQKTKDKKPKEYPGMLRKICDGQWVSDRNIAHGDITCPVCNKL